MLVKYIIYNFFTRMTKKRRGVGCHRVRDAVYSHYKVGTMSDERKRTALKRGDLYLVGGCLLAALVCCGLWLGLRRDGGTVIVEQDGRETARYALSEDQTVKIEGEGGYNVLVIQGGQAWLSEANCPNLLCVRSGKIRYAGQSVVCLPHRLAVRIAGGASGMDAVTGG